MYTPSKELPVHRTEEVKRQFLGQCKEAVEMKVNITSKGFTAGERQTALIEKKFSKLSKFFPEDTVADVTMGYKKNRQTMEAMIRVKGMIY